MDDQLKTDATGAAGSGPEPTPSADLGEAWRRAGSALAGLGSGIGESLRDAWQARRPAGEEKPADALRRLADAVERSAATARDAATAPEARQRAAEDAKAANEAVERAVRLSLAELGRALQRLEPKDQRDGPKGPSGGG